MTREEAIKLLRKLRETIDRNNAYGEAEEMGIQALEQEPCADAVSRQAVLEILQDYVFEEDEIESVTDECQNNMAESIARNIVQLPPVNPQNDLLDKIRAEIEKECEPCIYEIDFAYKKGLSRALEIIDKYRKGQTNEDSD